MYQYKGSHSQKSKKACITAQGFLQEQEACIPAQVSSKLEEQDKIKPETDDSLQEGPELESVMHSMELNQCTTSAAASIEYGKAKIGNPSEYLWLFQRLEFLKFLTCSTNVQEEGT